MEVLKGPVFNVALAGWPLLYLPCFRSHKKYCQQLKQTEMASDRFHSKRESSRSRRRLRCDFLSFFVLASEIRPTDRPTDHVLGCCGGGGGGTFSLSSLPPLLPLPTGCPLSLGWFLEMNGMGPMGGCTKTPKKVGTLIGWVQSRFFLDFHYI